MSKGFADPHIWVEKVYTEREVNFIVRLDGQYLFRLVPGEAGFEPSKLDRAIGQQIVYDLVHAVGDFIIGRDA